MRDGARRFFIWMDLGERDARGVIDTDMDELPAAARTLSRGMGAAAAIASDAMADAPEAAELLDIEMDHVAGMLMFVTPGRWRRVEISCAREFHVAQDTADGCGGSAGLTGDLAAR